MKDPMFDSRDPRYKTPYGAVACGAEITVALRPLPAEGFLDATLLLRAEFAEERREIPLVPSGTEEGRPIFSAAYSAPDQPELLWYLFRLRWEDGQVLFLGREGLCSQEERAVPWQQTVYEAALPTPGWFGRGVTYQIFPDRFRRVGTPRLSGLLGRRVFHPDWEESTAFMGRRDGQTQNEDYFGGNLAGVEEKLPYLHALGVSTLYLCPIFEADSNHRYNTGDYEAIDPMLGTEEDFRRLCGKAKALGIHVMLDGVFNHTGSNSRYFNAQGAYPEPGAAQSKDSPYYPWYTFQKWPGQYDSWWGVHTLPAVNEDHPGYLSYIVEDGQSIVRRWLRAGADAWRLDVADELPDAFIARVRAVLMEEKPEGILVGEVWEDGSNKISYGRRRKYLLGRECHGLMNYPFRAAALAYLLGGPGEDFQEAMETLRENYPPDAFYSAMNLLGTHDTPRVLTLLGTHPHEPPDSRMERASYRMSPAQRRRGLALLRVGAVLLYTFPGSPTVYYGDEAGMEGFEDPFNRGPYPWGREDKALQAHYARLGRLRRERPSLQSGSLRWMHSKRSLLSYAREEGGETTLVILNAGDAPARLSLPWPDRPAADALSGARFQPVDGGFSLEVPPLTGMVLL